nr:putative B3 domain-containing protein At1g78640 [Ipomoea batatas]
MDMERCRACQSRDGLRVKIWDLDTESSEHELSLKQWKTGSFLVTSNWNTDFVKMRSLLQGWQFCDHHPSHKSFQTNAATFAIFVIIIAKPFRLQHRDFLLRHSMASRGKRINDISPQCGESAQEEGKSTLPRSQVEKWIEVDFEAVVAQSKGGYGRSCHRSYSCNRPNPQSSVTWGGNFVMTIPLINPSRTNAATFAIFLIIIAKRFRLQHRDFLLRHSHVPMASRGKRFFIIITDSSCVVIQNHFTIQEIRFFQHVNNFQVDRQRHPIKPVSAANLVECKRRYRKNDISAQSSESAQEERKSTPHRSQVEKWIEVDFEPVVAQSYRRTWYGKGAPLMFVIAVAINADYVSWELKAPKAETDRIRKLTLLPTINKLTISSFTYTYSKNSAMESLPSTTTTVEDERVDLSATDSVRCFNDDDQEPPLVLALPLPNHHQEIITKFTLFTGSEEDHPTATPRNEDHLPIKKRKRFIIIAPNQPENNSIQVEEEEEGIIAKKHKVVDKTSPTGRPQPPDAVRNHHGIHKLLSTSDVNHSSRLLLPKEEITKYVLPLMDMESCRACQNRDATKERRSKRKTSTPLKLRDYICISRS